MRSVGRSRKGFEVSSTGDVGCAAAAARSGGQEAPGGNERQNEMEDVEAPAAGRSPFSFSFFCPNVINEDSAAAKPKIKEKKKRNK